MTDLHTELDIWLDTATRGLREKSRERIREEVSGHWDAARADALESGGDGQEATAFALASLGNARAARRRFRHEHFTAYEAFAYLGEDTEIHRDAEVRVKAFIMISAFFVSTLSMRILEFDSTTRWWVDLVMYVVASSVGLAFGLFFMWQVGRAFGWPKTRAQDPKKALRVTRAIGAGMTVVGTTVFILAALAVFANYMRWLVSIPFMAAATGPRLIVATLACLFITSFGAYHLYAYARLRRLFDIETGPKARD